MVRRLLRPAAMLVGRLRYAKKFAVVGLVLFLPLGLVAKAYVDLQHSQIAFSAKERKGVAYMAPLLRLTADTVRARHQAVTGGSPSRLGDRLAAIDDLDRRYGALFESSAAWRMARSLLLQADRAED